MQGSNCISLAKIVKFYISAIYLFTIDIIIFNLDNGGDFLELKTDNNDYDISYNREFQRMRYLTEEPAGNDPHTHTRDEQLIDLGWTFVPKGLDPFA
jgi:hypothetical protein